MALQRTAGNRAVSGLLTNVAAVQRRIDPDYATWKGAQADTRALIGEYYNNYVQPEYTRLLTAPVDPALITQMRADMRAVVAQSRANPFNAATAVTALNALATSINAADAEMELRLGVANPPGEDRETQARRERTRRAGAMTRIGTTKPGPVRGLRSATEGTTLLNELHTRVTTGLQGSGLAIGHVGVRGSSVTGIRSRTGEAFALGTEAHQVMSDASDHDYFFTCTGLEQLIVQHGDERNTINANGTMMGVYLLRILQRIAAAPTSNRNPAPRYPWAATLRTELIAFTDAAERRTGRKSDVTFISPTGATGAALATDPSTVIR